MAIRARNFFKRKESTCPPLVEPPVQPPVEPAPTKPKKPLKYFLSLLNNKS